MKRDPMERFLSFVRIDVDGCWIWTGYITPDGYGQFWADGTNHRAHKWIYEQTHGPVPSGRELDHFRCDKRACAHPDHVRSVTTRENVLRGRGSAARKRAQTHCVNGHEFDEDNTYIRLNGARSCIACQRERQRARYITRARRVPTHCPQGHPYTPENTRVYWTKQGRRKTRCRTCHREKSRARRRELARSVA